MSNRLIGYQSGQGFLYDLSGASKMLFFILVSVACMATYDPRFILAVGLLFRYNTGLLLLDHLTISDPKYKEIFLLLLRLLDPLLSLIYLWSTFSHLVMVKKFTEQRQFLLKAGGVSI